MARRSPLLALRNLLRNCELCARLLTVSFCARPCIVSSRRAAAQRVRRARRWLESYQRKERPSIRNPWYQILWNHVCSYLECMFFCTLANDQMDNSCENAQYLKPILYIHLSKSISVETLYHHIIWKGRSRRRLRYFYNRFSNFELHTQTHIHTHTHYFFNHSLGLHTPNSSALFLVSRSSVTAQTIRY